MPFILNRPRFGDTARPGVEPGVEPVSVVIRRVISRRARLIIAAVVVGMTMWAASQGTGPVTVPGTEVEAPAVAWTPTDDEARRVAERAVRSQLVAPTQATFEPPIVSRGADGLWTVFGTVDAMNAYGVALRHGYYVVLTPGQDGFTVQQTNFVQ